MARVPGESPIARARPDPSALALLLVVCVLLLAPGAVVLAPALGTLFRFGLPTLRVDLSLLVSSLAYASGIALLAVALAWPVARVLARAGPLVILVACVPLMMPTYLAYAGWGLLRAPDTWLGGEIARLSSGAIPNLAVYVGRAIAVGGMALAVFPFAAIVIAIGIRSTDPSVEDALRLECRGWRALRLRLAMHRASLIGAFVVVFQLMLGSGVPLHVAQARTFALDVWLELASWSPDVGARAWLKCWPILLVALLASSLLGGRLVRSALGDTSSIETTPRRVGRASYVGAAIVWTAGVLVPFALFAFSLDGLAPLERFWRFTGTALVDSGVVALVSGACAVGLGLLTLAACDGGRSGRLVVMGGVRAFVFAAIVPGVLIGSAALTLTYSIDALRPLADTFAIKVCTDLARFGYIPMLVALLVVWGEASESRWMRRLDGATGVRAISARGIPGALVAMLGGGLAVGLMSLQEIEAAVIVLPPGRENLARLMLNYLHYARHEDVAAAMVWLVGSALLVLVVAGLAAGLAGRSRRDV